MRTGACVAYRAAEAAGDPERSNTVVGEVVGLIDHSAQAEDIIRGMAVHVERSWSRFAAFLILCRKSNFVCAGWPIRSSADVAP
jgi:hypothetical protein